jgi:alpha-tubulin suppressor-like RCC1 family protein
MTPGLALPTAVCDDPNCSTRLDNVSQVVTAFQTVCALSNDSVLCWGDNGYDQLGDGSTSTTRPSQSYAATVSVASGAVAVVAGYQSNYAIIQDRADSYVIGWGNDGTGELGDATTLAMPSPSPVEPKW